VGTFHVSADRSSALHLFRGPLARRAERLDLRLAVSHTSREFVARYLPGPFQIVPNGVDPERFSPEVPPLPELCDGCFNVLFVGRLEPRKGIRNLFRAAALLAGRLPAPLRVVLVGEEGRTRFPSDPAYRLDRRGYVPPSELPRYYASCQVFCAPAVRRESFGIILLEAMASGVPVVATSIPGYRELISPDAEGLLVEPRDPGALAGALEALARDTERRRRLGESGRRKALRFSWERVVDRLEELYAGLVGGEREPVPLARAAQAGRP
jgi:phosphatidylinositol alpha-mannosyltransferase